jgi:tetratricopeptide (TPR) repeat protein
MVHCACTLNAHIQSQSKVAAAVAAFQRGDLARARRLAEEELARSNHYPLLHHLVGLIECHHGRFDRGVESLQRAFDAQPQNLNFRIHLARALVDGGRPKEGLDLIPVPCSAGLADIDLWLLRAEAGFAAGERGLESEAWQAICSARPSDSRLWMNLARSLLAQDRFGEAEAAYRNALDLAPSHLAAIHELGLTLERTSQIDKFRGHLGRALRAGVSKRQLVDLWTLRELRRGRPEAAWRLAKDIDASADPSRLYGLKAKAAAAAGKAAEAFEAADSMNRSVQAREYWRGRGRAYREELHSLDRLMKEWPRRLSTLPLADRPSPAFLVGFPRSGTTLADTFLMGHPDARVLEEQPMLYAAVEEIGGLQQMALATPHQLYAARSAYFAEVDRLVGRDFDGLVVDKLPLNMTMLPLIGRLFPDAKIIFAQRHPCDCVLSGFMQSFSLNAPMASFLDLADAAELYDVAMRLFTRGREMTGLSVHTLVYEELVVDPERALRPTIEFLGLDWKAQLLDHRATAAKRSSVPTPSYDSVSQPLSTRPIGRWRMFERQLAPAIPVLKPWAERLGYSE